ncbi:MAG: hypothetical protein ACM3UN_00400 [Bacillota bacterium]
MKKMETRINLKIPNNLPTVEENMLDMAITLEILLQPGLTKTAIERLSRKMKTLQLFQRLFRKYVRYRKLELEMNKLATKYEEMKTKS